MLLIQKVKSIIYRFYTCFFFFKQNVVDIILKKKK